MNKKIRVRAKLIFTVMAIVFCFVSMRLGINETWSVLLCTLGLVGIFVMNLIFNDFEDFTTDFLLMFFLFFVTLFSGLCIYTKIKEGNSLIAILCVITSSIIFYISIFVGFCNGIPNFFKDIPKDWYKIGKFTSGSYIYNRCTGVHYKEYSKLCHRILLFAYIHARLLGLKKDVQTQDCARFVQVGWLIKDNCK